MANSSRCLGSEEISNAIKSIMLDIQKQDDTQHVDALIQLIDSLLLQIKASGEATRASPHIESLASATTYASKIIDYISKEADKMSSSKMIHKELGDMGVKVLEGIAQTHWIFLGLSLVASSLQRYLTMKSNTSGCMELLEKLVELAKDVSKFKEAITGDMERVHKSVHVIVEGVFTCWHYITKPKARRYLTADAMKSQLQKTEESIKEIRASLIAAAVVHNAATLNRIDATVNAMEEQLPKRYELSPLKLLDFHPEDIDDQVTRVKTELNMEGSQPVLAVVIWGHGGIGKSTLAASVVQDLYSKSSGFKFSRVIIDQNTPDKTAHLVKLQGDLIFDFGGGKVDLRDPAEGRRRLREVMENNSCFLYIDNVVESDINELLPQLETAEQQKSKFRILLTSRVNNLKPHLKIKIIKDYHVEIMSNKAAKNLLTKTILQGEEKYHEKFDEEGMITKVAEACTGVPILLTVFGNHLKVEREEGSNKDILGAYKDVLRALQKGKLEKYSTGDEELLHQKLFLVYHKIRDEEVKEAFLDICAYFHGCEWDEVAHIVDKSSLRALQERDLVKRREDTLIVHDILRSMGRKEGKWTRLTNYKEFLEVKEDKSRLHNLKGLALLSTTSLTILDSKDLKAMHKSLRVLKLGNWVRLDGRPCVDAFNELRYLEIGDLKDFPFRDASKLEKLAVFYNSSKPGMELDQFPPNLKHIYHQVPYRDCNAFTKSPLKDLESVERFQVGTMRSVSLPRGFTLPASLVKLDLTGCKNLPKRFGELPALQSLILDKCDMEFLPKGLEQLTQVRHLSMECCTNLIILPDMLGSSNTLTYLSLRGCTLLEKLPDGLQMLHALQELNLAGCENLSALPDVFEELSVLQTLDLSGCSSLPSLPESFGRLPLRRLNLEDLASLEELPESFGDLPYLTKLSLISCYSLKCLPKTFARLRKLKFLTIDDCSKLTLSDCSFVAEVPRGFQALPNLRTLRLINCKSVLNLPMGLGELSCLKLLYVKGLPLSSLPDGFGKLQNLKNLILLCCDKLERVPQDFHNLVSLEEIWLIDCHMLDGATMDKIVKLQHCRYVNIQNSSMLIQRWNEVLKEKEEHAMVVSTGIEGIEERRRIFRDFLMGGQLIQLDSSSQELNHYSSMILSNDTTLVVMSGELHQRQLKQTAVEAIERATKRAKRNSSGHLLIIHVCTRDYMHGQTANEQEEMKRIRQILMLLPPDVSYAIPSTDMGRLRLIGCLFSGSDKHILSHSPGQQPFACYMADVRVNDQNSQILNFGNEKCIDDESTGTLAEEAVNSDEEMEVPDNIEEFINFICEGRAYQSSPEDSIAKDPPLSKEKFIEALNGNYISHFGDSNPPMIIMDQLEGKYLAVIMIDLHSAECMKLQEIYGSIQNKGGNFEAIWIAVSQHEDFGFGLGTYSRAIQRMPGIVLPDPNLIKLQAINDKSPRIIIFNQEGHIVNVNALPLIMSWGGDAYPFAENAVSQIVSNTHIKSSLDLLFHGMNFSNYEGIQELNSELSKKCIFVYAEPPAPKFRMNFRLQQFAETHENLSILYVGSFFCQTNDAESVTEVYENATQNMLWPKLSFWDMMTFWYRCQWLSASYDSAQEHLLTSLKMTVHLFGEKRWLILLDRDGIVTVNGKDVVELMCKEEDDAVDLRMKRELTESFKNGKCKQVVRTYFKDKISDYRHHPHPLMIARMNENKLEICCCRCQNYKISGPDGKRVYRCSDMGCDWQLCYDCWEEFAKQQVKIFDNPHPHPHPLMLTWKDGEFACEICGVIKVCGAYEKRMYKCSEDCDWHLCFDYWEEGWDLTPVTLVFEYFRRILVIFILTMCIISYYNLV